MNNMIQQSSSIITTDLYQSDKVDQLKTLNAKEIASLTNHGKRQLYEFLEKESIGYSNFVPYTNNYTYIIKLNSKEQVKNAIQCIDNFMVNQKSLWLGFKISLVIDWIEESGWEYFMTWSMYGENIDSEKVLSILNEEKMSLEENSI